jgi:hypothetical protein
MGISCVYMKAKSYGSNGLQGYIYGAFSIQSQRQNRAASKRLTPDSM